MKCLPSILLLLAFAVSASAALASRCLYEVDLSTVSENVNDGNDPRTYGPAPDLTGLGMPSSMTINPWSSSVGTSAGGSFDFGAAGSPFGVVYPTGGSNDVINYGGGGGGGGEPGPANESMLRSPFTIDDVSWAFLSLRDRRYVYHRIKRYVRAGLLGHVHAKIDRLFLTSSVRDDYPGYNGVGFATPSERRRLFHTTVNTVRMVLGLPVPRHARAEVTAAINAANGADDDDTPATPVGQFVTQLDPARPGYGTISVITGGVPQVLGNAFAPDEPSTDASIICVAVDLDPASTWFGAVYDTDGNDLDIIGNAFEPVLEQGPTRNG